jgi:hypothetical protein
MQNTDKYFLELLIFLYSHIEKVLVLDGPIVK